MAPAAYFLTWHTYGTWLHGRQEGSVDRNHNTYGTPLKPRNDWLHRRERRLLTDAPLILNDLQRGVIDDTIRGVCEHKGWKLLALKVHPTHVHAVVAGAAPPAWILNTLKAQGARRLREKGVIPGAGKVWSRHGSTLWLWTPEAVAEKCAYVESGQGPDLPMRYE